jgi:trigger factor
MKSSLESPSNLERKLNIEVPAAEVQAAFERALIGVQRSVQVKGFRKGKAPLQTIRSIYGDRLKQDVIQDIIQANYVSALKEHSLDPVSPPTIEFDPLEDAKDFAFTVEFEIRPEVKLKKVEGLTVQKEKLEVTEKTIGDTIDEIRRARAEVVPVFEDRPAQLGDTAVIDFKGFIDGKELENGAAEGHSLELGSNTFIPGFEEGVVGMRPGVTAKVKAQFPEGYHVADLAGKPVEFDVTLKELKSKKLPELNDEFAKTLGPYESFEALKKAVQEDFEKRETKRINDDLKNRIMKVLVDNNPVAVPKALMIEQKKALIEDVKTRMEQQGMGEEAFDDYKQKWDPDFEQTASYMIQSSFLIDTIANENNLRATPSDIDVKMSEYAANTGIEMTTCISSNGRESRRLANLEVKNRRSAQGQDPTRRPVIVCR